MKENFTPLFEAHVRHIITLLKNSFDTFINVLNVSLSITVYFGKRLTTEIPIYAVIFAFDAILPVLLADCEKYFQIIIIFVNFFHVCYLGV